jgi:hypothetical protein
LIEAPGVKVLGKTKRTLLKVTRFFLRGIHKPAPFKRMKLLSKGLFPILLGLIIALRIWIILQAPQAFGFDPGDAHPDQGVVVLMAKHILQGGEFPIFHYGQPYLGSMEAFLLSIIYLLFGFNFWVIHIVPVLCYTLFCYALFLLAKNLIGFQCGLWALLWCAVAPLSLTEYSVMPQLGNITAPMFGTLILLITVISLKSSDLSIKRWGYGLVGLLAGVGWWTSPMLIYYLFTIPLFILIKEKGGEILKGGLWGVFLFLVGALPFFCYYELSPQTKVLSMGQGYSLKYLKEGLPLFFLDRIHYFLDLDKFALVNRSFFWLGLSVYLFATAFFFWNLRRDWLFLLRYKNWPRISLSFILGLFSLIFLITISSSIHLERNAARYFFPLASFFPFVLGLGAISFSGKKRLIPIFFIFLVLWLHATTGWDFIRTRALLAKGSTETYISLVKALEEKGIYQVYSWQRPGSEIINYYSQEKVLSSRPLGERYRPYEDILEKSGKVAFLDAGDKPIVPTLKVIGGNSRHEQLNPYVLYFDFTPPLGEYREIPKTELTLSASDHQENVLKMIDRRWDTEWSSGNAKIPGMWVKVDLGKIRPLGMIRLFNQGNRHAQYAYNLEIKASSDGLTWQTICPETNTDLYYWDGPRLYYWELNYRWEFRFGPLSARYLLLINKEHTERFPWNIGEIWVFEDRGHKNPADFKTGQILDRIQKLNLQKVYAGRWLSAQIKTATQGRIKTIPVFTESDFEHWPFSRIVEFGPKTGWVIDLQDQTGFEEMLQQAGIPMTSEYVGRWRLYYFKEWPRGRINLADNKEFWWTGFGMLRVGPAVWNEYHRRGLDVWR